MNSRRLWVLIWPTTHGEFNCATATQPLQHCGELATQTLYLLIAAAPDRSRATTEPTPRSPKCTTTLHRDPQHTSNLLDIPDRAQLSPLGPLDPPQQLHTSAATIRSNTSEIVVPSRHARRVHKPMSLHQCRPRAHTSGSRRETAPGR